METTVFLSNRSQAVRLPKAVALPEDVQESSLPPVSPGTVGLMAKM